MQTVEPVEKILELINLQIYNLPIYVFLGIVYIALLEMKTITSIIKQRKKISKKNFRQFISPILKRLSYIGGGVVLTFSGFFVIAFIQRFIAEPVGTDYTDKGNYSLILTGVLTVLAFQFAGVILILSAGGRWMVNFAKLIIVAAVAGTVVVQVLATAQLI